MTATNQLEEKLCKLQDSIKTNIPAVGHDCAK
jgi:hypothetical protein